jgi:hypothetical protein
VASILPVSATSYIVFFLLGLPAICLLFVRATYNISVKRNMLEISIKIFIKIILRRLAITRIEDLQELSINDVKSSFKIIKTDAGNISYLIKIPKAIKVHMPDKKSYIISTNNPQQLINMVKSLMTAMSIVN